MLECRVMKRTAFLLAMAAVIGTAFADAPLSRPSNLEVWSKNKQYVAVLKHQESKTSIFRVMPDGKREKTWEMDGWFRWTHLSNDGEYFAIPYWGANLLSLNYKKEDIMLRLVQRGKTIATVTLTDLIEDFSQLQRTASHYYWGHCTGFNKQNEFVITTVEGNCFLVSPKDGKIRKQEKKLQPEDSSDKK
jgi:hypothetical protein